MSVYRCTEWRGEHAAIVDHHVNHIDLLALYEDLVYSPETLAAIIREWKEWEDAKNEGRLQIMPKGDEKPATMVFLAKGHAFLGRRARDSSGNIYIDEPAHFDFDDEGGAVAVGTINTATMKISEEPPPEVYGDFDPAGYLKKALQLLRPSRRGNIPDLENMVKKWALENSGLRCPFFQECESMFCSDCIIKDWIDEAQEGCR